MRWLALSVAMLLAASSGAVAVAAPKASAKAAPKKVAKARSAGKGTQKQCWGSGAKRKCQRVAVFSGQNAPAAALRKDALAKPSGDVWLRAVNLNAEVRANIYKADG